MVNPTQLTSQQGEKIYPKKKMLQAVYRHSQLKFNVKREKKQSLLA